jgi:hypothetical protein
MRIANRKAAITLGHFSLDGLRYLLVAVVVAVLPLTLAGCPSKSSGVRITGNTSYKGQPIPGGVIMFYPTEGRAVSASITADGSYSVDLNPGNYVVTVDVGIERPPGFKEGDKLPPAKMVLPMEYTTRTRSKLTASVTKEGNRTIDFPLK